MTFKTVMLVLLASALSAACGGGGVVAGAVADADKNGGSSATTTPSGSGTGTGTPTTPTAMKLELVDAQGNVLASPTLSQTSERYLKVTAPNLQAYKRVEIKLDNALAVITPSSGTQLSSASGVALLAISPAGLVSNGVVRATATVAADGGDVSKQLDLQVQPASVALTAVSAAPATVQLGQAVTVSVNASVDGAAARANSLSVSFSSTCGTVTPASAPVDASGKATAVIQTATVGNCTVSAAAAGLALPLSAAYAVTNTPVLGINFVKVDPQVIYFKESVGPRTAWVTFKVFDANGRAVAGQRVNAAMVTPAEAADFCGVQSPSAISSATGEVAFAVCSRYLPSSVQVRATLDGSEVHTSSNLLTVQTGMPSQRFFDLAADKLNFHAGAGFTDRYNGLSVSITAFAADRHGNPVPDGTPVVFVSEGGQINTGGLSSCVIRGGSCSVNLIGQDYRPWGSSVGDPRPGRVTVLAMADGEEHYVDTNSNGKYDTGEPIEDLGLPFLDKDEDGVYSPAYKNLSPSSTDESDVIYPGVGGDRACTAGPNAGLSVAKTCNGTWNGYGLMPDGSNYSPTKVRRSIVVVFSGGDIGYPNAQDPAVCQHTVATGSYDATIPKGYRTQVLTCSRTGMRVQLADRNGNPLPADAALSVTVRKTKVDGQCVASLGNGSTVIGNSTNPTQHDVTLTSCVAGDIVDLTVKTADGSRTSTFSVTVP